MKKLMIIFTLAMASYHMTSAQSAQSFYFELGGPGIASFNFDTRLSGRQDGIGARIGVGGYSIDGDGVVFLPVGLNYLLGGESRHYFEVGAGANLIGKGMRWYFQNFGSPYLGTSFRRSITVLPSGLVYAHLETGISFPISWYLRIQF